MLYQGGHASRDLDTHAGVGAPTTAKGGHHSAVASPPVSAAEAAMVAHGARLNATLAHFAQSLVVPDQKAAPLMTHAFSSPVQQHYLRELSMASAHGQRKGASAALRGAARDRAEIVALQVGVACCFPHACSMVDGVVPVGSRCQRV